MGTVQTISRTALARKTREVLEQVRRGHPAVIESYGEEQAVLLDALDYRLLCALASRTLGGGQGAGLDRELQATLGRYLGEEISVGKVAEELGLSRFELMQRFERLGVPLHLGPTTKDEARAEVEAALRHRRQR
jgi:prevent-host-death family protein